MKARRSKSPGTIPTLLAAAPVMALGRLAPGSTVHSLLLQIEGRAPLPARTTLALDDAAVRSAVVGRQPALALFENGDPGRPIIVGLVQPDQGAALLGALLAQPGKGAPVGASSSRPAAPVEARVDGKRVVIEGNDEVTLKCGEASITLRRDGKLIVRGTYVETTAKGVNRIRGGSVKIN